MRKVSNLIFPLRRVVILDVLLAILINPLLFMHVCVCKERGERKADKETKMRQRKRR